MEMQVFDLKSGKLTRNRGRTQALAARPGQSSGLGPKQHDIAVLHHMLAAFRPDEPLIPGRLQ